MPMSQRPDAWYVRLPDGRVLRASSTTSLRRHIESGRIPLGSRVRRSPEDEWGPLEWTDEFADLVAPPRRGAAAPQRANAPARAAGGAARPNGMELQTAGVQGMVEDLLTALDS